MLCHSVGVIKWLIALVTNGELSLSAVFFFA